MLNDGEDTVLTNCRIQFGQWLIKNDIISSQELELALEEQQQRGGRLGEVLCRLGILGDQQLVDALTDYLSVEYYSLDDVTKLDIELARIIPESVAERFTMIAVGRDGDKIVVAMSDPTDIIALDTVSLKIKHPVRAVISSTVQIKKAHELIYRGSYMEEEHLRDLVQTQEENEYETVELLESDVSKEMLSAEISGPVDADKAPVIRFVDLVLGQAVKSNASDIHLEPQDRLVSVRMRVDGRLRNMLSPPWKMYAAVVTRVKILSQMNIAERRLPQDGRFRIKAPGRDIDVRVSVIPVIYGEKVVMRILDKSSINHDIDSLGFDEGSLETFKSILNQPHGIIVVTGPTGSGKSTTLYSSLNYLKDPTKNITTVEDPVEYRMAGVNQIQVKSMIGLDFAASLRAILRQDPDIILIGEIRDRETVEIAIKASLTGHLVLSTFHTNDAPSALTRLSFMGVDRYLLASTINLVVAQRLIRRICCHCKEKVKLVPQVLKSLRIDSETAGKTTFYRGRGCNMCGDSGYSGRIPIFEFMVMTAEIRSAVVNNMSESEIRKLARKDGHGGLLECGVRRLIEGVTTAEEVLNTTFSEDIV